MENKTSRLPPGIRTGLICAGLHQVCALFGILGLWLGGGFFLLPGAMLWLADVPVYFVWGDLFDQSPALVGLLQKIMPAKFADHIPDGFLGCSLTLGALQWFLIGLFLGAIDRRREPRKQTP